MKIPVWNILPCNDLKEHKESGDCHCKPEVKVTDHSIIIVHNSFDGREAVEMANEILNNPK